MAALGCHRDPPPVAPGPPLPAAAEIEVGAMDAECDALSAALEQWRACPNLDDEDRAWLRATEEYAEQSFAAGKKAAMDAPSQHTVALACRKATVSIKAANERCHAGPKPPPED